MSLKSCIIWGSLLAMAVGMMGSCVKDNGEVVDYDVALAFNPAIYSPVRSALGGSYPEGVPLGVTASTLPVGSSWESDWAEGKSFLVDEKVVPQGERWLPQSNCNWPHVGMTLTCIAYSPYGAASGCNFTDGVVFSGVDVRKNQADLLYTDPVEDAHKGAYGGVVALPFKHALGSISIKVKNLVEDSDRIVVKKVKLLQAVQKGSFRSLPSAQWTLEGEPEEIVFYNGEFESTQAPGKLGEKLFIIPQTLATCFEVDFIYYTAAGTYITQTLRTRDVGTLIEQGRNYTYTLSVGIDEVKFMLEVIDSYLQ